MSIHAPRRDVGRAEASTGRGLRWRWRLTAGLASTAVVAGGVAAALAGGVGVQAASVRSQLMVNPVARYLSVNAAHKTATLTLLAGLPAAVGGTAGYDFNGYARGTMTVSVPKGWRVVVHCENKGRLPHSCAVVSSDRSVAPAFPGASLPPPSKTKGLAPGRTGTFSFVPTRLGHFLIASLVPGNEAKGMWDHFAVTAARSATIVAKPAASPTPPPTTGAVEVLTIAADPNGALRYTKSQLTALRPGKIKFEFTNNSPIAHNFTLSTPAGNVIAAIPTFIGGTRDLTITLKAGVYGYYCSVDHHELAGMQGALIVK